MGPGDHLFRREAGRMVAALTRIFGVHNLTLAEDVVQDALCRALEVWKFRGVPENPGAWLMAVAKNRALDVLRRERTARSFAPELGRLLESEWTMAPVVSGLFGPGEIRDDVLRLMFSCCHPRLPGTAQVALVLNTLCGFGVTEIAAAFFDAPAAVEKRLTRGSCSFRTGSWPTRARFSSSTRSAAWSSAGRTSGIPSSRARARAGAPSSSSPRAPR